MLIIAFVGWVIAYLLKVLVRSILRLTKFSKLSENAGATQLLNQAALPSSTELLSRFVFWVAWVGFILLGVSVLGIVGLQEYISRFFLFLPRLFVALVILFFGLLAASFFSRAALLAAVNANFRSSRLLSISIRVIISIFALSMVFEVLGVAEQTMLIAFGTAFGAVMLGLAIAFGIGGKDLAREFLEKRLVPGKKRRRRMNYRRCNVFTAGTLHSDRGKIIPVLRVARSNDLHRDNANMRFPRAAVFCSIRLVFQDLTGLANSGRRHSSFVDFLREPANDYGRFFRSIPRAMEILRSNVFRRMPEIIF